MNQFKKLQRGKTIFEVIRDADGNGIRMKWGSMTEKEFEDLLTTVHYWTLQHGYTSERLLKMAPKTPADSGK